MFSEEKSQIEVRAAVSVRQATKTYEGGVEALRGVSLELASGEVTALVGRSGCGKTTLLNLCGGMDFPTSGEVEVAGLITTDLNDTALTGLRRNKIGFVFQFFQLLPTLTALENIELPLLLSGASNVRATARERLDWVGLPEKADALPWQLSGGQAQRVAIARALAQRPVVMLADEPVASLDPEAAQEIMRLLRKMAHDEGLAVLCVLHQVDLAFAYADRVVGMRDGRVAFDRRRADVSHDQVQRLYLAEAA